MDGFVANIEQLSLANSDFRRVLFTGPNTQLVLMTLQPGEDIGVETHDGLDQFVRVEIGKGLVRLNGVERALSNGSAVVIPAGVEHNIVNISATQALQLYTLYSPPAHPEGTVHHTRQEAVAVEQY